MLWKAMKAPKAADVKRGISVICENLQCPICLDLMSMPVSTKCDHQFCRFCMMKLLDRNKKKEANCPVCKAKVTRRSLQESPGFQRLVEGLQHLVRAYEEDTGTDCFTGTSQRLENLGLQKAGPRKIQHKRGKDSSCDGQVTDSADSSQSRSPEEERKSLSSVEAMQAYAKLMGLEDSCTVISDKEGLDSGLADMPQPSEMETDGKCMPNNINLEEQGPSVEVTKPVGAAIIETRQRRDKKNTSHHSSLEREESPEEVYNKTDRQSHRSRKTVDSDPEKIIDKRCKRSLQKVSEWLLKISPTDVDEDDMGRDGYASDGGSSSSTVKEDKGEEQPVTFRRDDRNRSLEEQVFGVVYRRDRKSMRGQLDRAMSPETRGVTDLPACGPTEEAQAQEIASNRRTSSRLKPIDEIYHTEEKVQETVIVNLSGWSERTAGPIKGQSDEVGAGEEVKQTELSSHCSNGKKMEQVEPLGEECNAEDSPVFEVSLRRTKKRARTNLGSTWKEVDNLCQDGEGELGNCKENGKLSKRKSESKKKENRFTQRRLAKATRPLDLISIGVNDPVVRIEKGPLMVETDVQIESYPSSMSPGNPTERVTRRSKRLQVFTEEIQGCRKLKSARSIESVIPHSDSAKAGGKAGFEKTAVTDGSPLRKKTENNVMRNGCVVDVDMGDIQKIVSSFGADMEIQCRQKESSTKESPPEVNIQCSQFKDVHPTSQPSQDCGKADELQIHACQDVQVEVEEDEKNDSEQDTEQLLKTFKATKRRSFHLGVPSHITSDRDSLDCDKQNQEGALEGDLVNGEIDPNKDSKPSCLVETIKQAEVQQNQDNSFLRLQSPSVSKKTELENSCSSDLIPPTHPSDHTLHNSMSLKKRHILTRATSNEGFGECSNSNARKSHRTSLTRNSGIRSYAIRSDEASSTGRKRKNSDTSSRVSQTVDSMLLFQPDSIASEEAVSAIITEKMHLEEAEFQTPMNNTADDSENSGVLKPGMVEFACPVRGVVMDSVHGSHGPCSRHQAGKLSNSGTNQILESSLTPDDLLPPNVVVTASAESIVSARLKQGARSVETTTQRSSEGNLALRKRKRSQRLESSESEGSDEEDELPSFAELFGRGKRLTPAVEEPVPPSADPLYGQVQASPEDLAEGAPVSLKDTAENVSITSQSPQWVPASQASVDLFDTPGECEDVPDERGPSESSQFSNEILATQQKVAMQEELRRLEKMMALVTEALHQKADGPQARVTGGQASPHHPGSAAQSGQDLHRSPPCSDRTGGGHTRRNSSPLSPISSPGPRTLRHRRGSDREGIGTGWRGSRRGQSLRSSGVTGGNTASRAPVAQDDTVETLAAAPSSEREERGLLPPGGAPPAVRTAGQARSGTARGKMVLVGSGLSVAELSVVKKFSKKTGGSVSAQVTPETTHVIIGTDEDLVCERTLKYFLGIAARKWVVSFQWIVECFNQGKVLNEVEFEVRGDVVNGHRHQGPMKARTTRDQKLLMRGYEVCFQGSFTDMTTDQMEWMVELCGATVVKDPLLFTGSQMSTRLVVVQQPTSEESHARDGALQKRATVLSRGWLLDSVATYTLQNTDEYRV
ncbi:hypothetical protein AAFF_G00052020 [Aldrovandia affinis]|uniref:RING-type E3 ubiquitin transferase BRCA1 n=1 Tax=Aldrovandia affinis TaxID=143900 RepID=A0AAD7T4J9_9TELE|nr:hypothetical protein AAFF_G00052020 [Aldrovandia affinis]